MITVIDAPSDLGLKPTGVATLAATLRHLGLLTRLPHARDAGSLDPPAYRAERDPAAGVRNAAAIRAFSGALADRVETVLAAEEFPLVLGGDCSILIGIALALQRRGRYGLLFLDGHADFYSPDSEPSGEAASMELAIVTGHGPRLVDARRPLMNEDDVVAFGIRDLEEAAKHGSPDIRRTDIELFDCAGIQRQGVLESAHAAVASLTAAVRLDGFWIHLDADVLADDVMPAVDYRMPGGLSPSELTGALQIALKAPGAIGMDVTIYNPALDDEQLSAGRCLTDILAEAFVAHG